MLHFLYWGLMLVNEYSSMNTRQQWTKPRNILERWGFLGSDFGRNLKCNYKEEHKTVLNCLCYESIVLTFQ